MRRSGDCNGVIGPFETKTCTFTNEYTALSTILVKKKVICPTGFVCPTPDKFSMKLEAIGGIVDPATFPGSETGTRVTIAIPETSAAPYRVTETFPPPVSGLNLFVSQDMGCLGDIRPQESKTCSITNEYRVAPTP